MSSVKPYVQYYSSADVSVFLEGSNPSDSGGGIIKLDTLRTVTFKEQYTSAPIFGLAKDLHGFINRGNLVVSGLIELNFTDHSYMKDAIDYVKGRGTRYSTETIKKLMNNHLEPMGNILAAKSAMGRQQAETASGQVGIDSFQRGFNIRVVFNNSNAIYGDISKEFLISEATVVGSDLVTSSAQSGPVSVTYQFLAKQIQ